MVGISRNYTGRTSSKIASCFTKLKQRDVLNSVTGHLHEIICEEYFQVNDTFLGKSLHQKRNFHLKLLPFFALSQLAVRGWTWFVNSGEWL